MTERERVGSAPKRPLSVQLLARLLNASFDEVVVAFGVELAFDHPFRRRDGDIDRGIPQLLDGPRFRLGDLLLGKLLAPLDMALEVLMAALAEPGL